MATWNPLTDTETGHKKPVVMSLFRRLRDMVISVIEADPSAPKIETRAINSRKFVFACPTSGTSFVMTSLNGYSTVRIDMAEMTARSNGGGTIECWISLSSDNGSTWAAETKIATAAVVGSGNDLPLPDLVFVGLRDGLLFSSPHVGFGYTPGASAIALPGGTVNAIRFRLTGNVTFVSNAAARGLFMGVCD